MSSDSNRHYAKPPKWADRFLQWYCNPAMLEEVQGDVHELFARRVDKEGVAAAKRKFIWDIIRFCRWRNIKRNRSAYQSNSSAMIRNYFLVGIRNIWRNSVISSINAFGLALGVAGAVTIFIFADQFFHVDNFHKNRERIYEVTNVINRNNERVVLSDVPLLLGPSMEQDIPAVEKAVRIEIAGGAVRYNDKVFSENIYFVDNSFFDVFTFPFKEGNGQVLSDKTKIVFTTQMAEKYFGNQQAVGQSISIKFGNNRVEEFVVGAVVEQPTNNTMYFNFLLPIENFFNLKLKDSYDWNYLTNATFIMMAPGAVPSVDMMKKYIALQNEASNDWQTQEFKFYPLPSLVKQSYEIEGGLMGSGHPQGVLAMASIATMLLLLACFNYMNISIATITTRLKEIGIRKVIGGRRKEIIHQFIIENFSLSFLSVSLGVLFSYLILMPALNSLLSYKIPFAFSSGQIMILFFAGLLLFIITVSGIYPAVYISGFQPVVILKGREKFGQKSKFSRVLLTFQFILAFITIVGSFVYIDNTMYLARRDWGYNHDQNLIVPVSTREQYLALKDRVAQQPGVVSLAGSANHIGYWNTRSSVTQLDRRFEIVDYRVGFNYLETMNLRLAQGRFFDESIQSDQIESVVVNQRFVDEMGWNEGINQTFLYDSVMRTVVGVVQDFHFSDFYTSILPVVFRVVPDEKFRFLSIKVDGEHLKKFELLMANEWKQVAPDDPYDGFLQDEVFANFRQNISTDSKILGSVAAIAVTLACLGLFGLVSYNITRRMREFSIRKIFGASIHQIFKIMNNDYLWILLISFGVGAPLGFFFMDNLIHHIYPDPQDAGPFPFLLAIGLMVFTVAITVLSQMSRISRENPATTLRTE